MTKYWPIPDSYSKKIPKKGEPGSFLENRGDRIHLGVDIYTPYQSPVLAIEDGVVIDTGVFTLPEIMDYWNKTYFLLIKNKSGLVCKYAEFENIKVKKGDLIKAGQLIGFVGCVLNREKITKESPEYIRKLSEKNMLSMLHFELCNSDFTESLENYKGGNWFSDNPPKEIIDPTSYLESIK